MQRRHSLVLAAAALLAASASAQSITTSNSVAGAAGDAPPPRNPAAVLYDQMDNPAPTPGGVTSQDFEAAFDGFDAQAADDFVVPAPGWTVESVDVDGEYSATGPAASFHVYFYADAAGLPGALEASRLDQSYTGTAGDASITLSPPVDLAPGTYWVSVQARQDFNTAGQWFWDNRTVSANGGAAWQNPGGGFGTPCTTWGNKMTCLPTQNGPDQLFRLNGQLAAVDLSILIVAADSEGAPAALQTALLAEAGVGAVDVFDAAAGTPGLAALAPYDVVVPFSNSPFADATALGDNLADYVDGGGRVVQLGFSYYGPGQPYGINGRWLTDGYNPYDYSTNLGFDAFTLGTFDAGDPLMSGVTALASDYHNIVVPAAGAVEIAQASDGDSLVARRDRPANMTVGVTAYVGAAATWSGDFAHLILNAYHVLFVDGFETGDTTRWTVAVP